MMDSEHYLQLFKNGAAKLDTNKLHQKGIELVVGTWLDSVVLKLSKPEWNNNSNTQPQTGSAIFFSIWVSDEAVKQSKISYNIHALKLRKLKGYKIASREFATAFRGRFKDFSMEWPNVSTDFGPLTLMEGWIKLNEQTLENDIVALAEQFLKIDAIIDDLLVENAVVRS